MASESDGSSAPGPVTPDASSPGAVGGSTYALLTGRLAATGASLAAAAAVLNERRSDAFAGVSLAVRESVRVTLPVSAALRDTVAVGDLLLVGYNMAAGMARGDLVDDTLALFRLQGRELAALSRDDAGWFLSDASFVRDLGEIYRYYSAARFLSFRVVADQLCMVFGVGQADGDIKVLRWRLTADGPLYIDAFGEQTLVPATAYDFAWVPLRREMLVDGRHAHYQLAGGLSLSLSAGHLEIFTRDALGAQLNVVAEPVAQPDADLTELQASFAVLGDLILVRVQPYRERVERFFVYSCLSMRATRVDAIAMNCHQLPESQGIVFPGGFVLQNGQVKVFSGDPTGLEMSGSFISPNGEDLLYVFDRPSSGERQLLCYNLVDRTMSNPILSVGFALFGDGSLVTLRPSPPSKTHTVTLYDTPFIVAERYVPAVAPDSFFGKVGNPEMVSTLGECFSLARDAQQVDFNAAVFQALAERAQRLIDVHSFLSEPEAEGIGALLAAVASAAAAVLAEFAAAAAAKKAAAAALVGLTRDVDDYELVTRSAITDAAKFIDTLAAGRTLLAAVRQGSSMRDVDAVALDRLIERCEAAIAALGGSALEFLAGPDATRPLVGILDSLAAAGTAARSSAELGTLIARSDDLASQLTFLTTTVGDIAVEDVSVKTAVLAGLSELLARRNAVRAQLESARQTLAATESDAAFSAALGVLAQRAAAELMASRDAASLDGSLTTLLAELETIELRFGEVSSRLPVLADKRDELYNTFQSRRDEMAASLTGRVDALDLSAKRVLATLTARASALASVHDVDVFFAGDALADKVRSVIKELTVLGAAGRSSQLEVAFGAARDTARRTCQDRAELYSDSGVRIGSHSFPVNRESFEVRLAVGNDDADGEDRPVFQVRLAGTDLTLGLDDAVGPSGQAAVAALEPHLDLASQSYISETGQLPRALFLAFESRRLGTKDSSALVASQPAAGYELGVHDHDAELIAAALAPLWESPGMWFTGTIRALSMMWLNTLDTRTRAEVSDQLRAMRALPEGSLRRRCFDAWSPGLVALAADAGVFSVGGSFDAELALDYLTQFADSAAVSVAAVDLARQFTAWASATKVDIRNLASGPLVHFVRDFQGSVADPDPDLAAEAAWVLQAPRTSTVSLPTRVEVAGLLSTHPMIRGASLSFSPAQAFCAYLTYRRDVLPRFEQFAVARREVLALARSGIGLDKLVPRPAADFVRNRLVNDVYLPLIGENLSRQLGLAGSAQGLLMLVSPPGYGKTSLVEYVTALLGFAIVKINGPALSERTVSLDPAQAPDASAAAELVKLNRAFAMANNVLLYIDDIQHTSAEFLQKFISLCDATRRVDGVFNGAARTFDLTGRRFVVVMAGNPYTSDGSRFKVPDMLTNRADVHNLGDMASGHAAAFAHSYIVNAAGSNATLAPVLSSSRRDLEKLIAATATQNIGSGELEGVYAPAELTDVFAVLAHATQVRDVMLSVNAAYISSASMDDAMRAEPPFLLQGSYRTMARILSAVVPAMTSDEVSQLVRDHYRSEAQTLADAAAWNLAKLELVYGSTSEAHLAAVDDLRRRWAESNVGTDPLSVIASSVRALETSVRRFHDDRTPHVPSR